MYDDIMPTFKAVCKNMKLKKNVIIALLCSYLPCLFVGQFYFFYKYDSVTASLPFCWGGVCPIVANLVFYCFAFFSRGALKAGKIVKNFFVGEGVKLLLTCWMCAVLLLTSSDPSLVLCGYLTVICSGLLVPIVDNFVKKWL